MATGDHDWTAGEQVTAANVDDYLQLQVVQQFATAAARDSALSARKREGMVTYQIDTNSLTVYSGAAWSTIGPAHGALTAYTPTWTQLGTVTHTVNNSTYQRVGRGVYWQFTLTATGSGTAANVVTLSLPVNASYSNDFHQMGTFSFLDTSAPALYVGRIVTASVSTIKFDLTTNAQAANQYLGTTSFVSAIASGDAIGGSCFYEAAADA